MKYPIGLLIVGTSLLSLSAPAQDKKDPKKDQPKVIVAVPLSVSPGATTKVTIRGLKIDTATEVRLQTATAKLLKTAKTPVPNNQEPTRLGDSLVEIEVTLPADLPSGEIMLQ